MRDRLDEWRGSVREAVGKAVTKARKSVADQGLVFLGASAVMKKSFLQRAKTYEEKRKLNPVLAARNVFVRRSFIRIEKAFRTAYRVAMKAWRRRERGVVFPAGTWWMVIQHRAEARSAPA